MGADYIPGTLAGQWRQDPVSLIPLAMGAHWAEVKPFVLRSAQQFRLPPPPALTSAEYTAAFDEVKRLGGDGITTATVRTEEEKTLAIFWAYDEFNGITRDNSGQVRALSPRSFSTLSQAETENGRSRIYLGIHWDFDCTRGIEQGRAVADFVMRNAFEPTGRPRR